MKSELPSSFEFCNNTSRAQKAAAVFESQCSCSIYNEDILIQRRNREMDGVQRCTNYTCFNGQLSLDLQESITLVKCQDEFLEFSSWLLNTWYKVWSPSFFLKDPITLSNFQPKMLTSLLVSTVHEQWLALLRKVPTWPPGREKGILSTWLEKKGTHFHSSWLYLFRGQKLIFYRPSLTYTSCPCPFQDYDTSGYWQWPTCWVASHFKFRRDSSLCSRLCSNNSFHKYNH